MSENGGEPSSSACAQLARSANGNSVGPRLRMRTGIDCRKLCSNLRRNTICLQHPTDPTDPRLSKAGRVI